MIILDFCSGNTCKNSWDYAKRMIDEMDFVVKEVGFPKEEIIIKWQLFLQAGDNIPLDRKIFRQAYEYAKELGYKTTASVFDRSSLNYLLKYDVLFIKIACVPETRTLIYYIPRGIPVIASYDKSDVYKEKEYSNMIKMFCVRQYPALKEDYENILKSGLSTHHFGRVINQKYIALAVSDHTIGLKLFNEYYKDHNYIWEKHYKLEYSTGLDAGTFAITPKELKNMLICIK